ncbi:MAG: PAS domain-containing protein [Loktanella sp.]|nr:PAS domain-containing protein [Loktanella sp.]
MENLDPLAILKTMHQPLVVLDSDLVVKGANRAFYTTFKVEPDETEGVAIYDLGNAQWDIPKLRDLLSDILPNSGSVDDFMVEHSFESIGRRIMKINAREITFKVDRGETVGRLVFDLGNNQWDIPKLRELLEDVIPENNTVDDFEVEHDFKDIGHRLMVLNARRIDHLQLILLSIDLTAHRVIERTQFEDAERRSFTLELIDRMRGERTPDAIVDVTCEALGRRLGANQVFYGEIDEAGEPFVPRFWQNGPAAGQDAEITFSDRLKEGQTLAIEDVQGKAAVSSLVYAPLMEDGQLRAVLGVHFLDPHDWQSVDIKLVEDVAERLRDAVARCNAEAELRASEERFLLATKATNDVIWDWSMVEGTYWCNENLQLMFGHDPARIKHGPESWMDRIHAEDRERVAESFNLAVKGPASTWTDEYRYLHADGKPATVLDRAFIIRDPEGKVVRMLGSMVDLTAERDMESRLRQAQKLEAVGHLTGGVAHDFNNLLTVILGNAEMLSDDLDDRHDLRRLAKMIETTAERGAELIKSLLAFSRTQTLEPRLVDVSALISGVEGMLRRTLPANIDIAFNRTGRRWKTEIDPSQLESAILNLTLNARDAMPGGGLLTIEIANAELSEDNALRDQDVTPGQYVMITISDTGEGIPPESMARIFEPFFTTKEVGEGSGLGLSMVYGFVKQSGGHIHITSTPGEGTSVNLYFPRSPGADIHSETQVANDGLVGGHEAILVVEDDTLVREQLMASLTGLGYRVIGAASGIEALGVLKQNPVDLLFTDIVLPSGMNGHQLADTVRTLWPETKLLFTSGYMDKALVHDGQIVRDVELLNKPYRREQLATKVRKVLDRR